MQLNEESILTTILALFVCATSCCAAEGFVDQDYSEQILSRAEEYIVNDTSYRAKEAIVALIQELKQNPTYCESGSGDLSIKFIALQSSIEQVLASARASGELIEVIGYMHAPYPAKPFCIRPHEPLSPELIARYIAQGFDRELTVRSRAKILRDLLCKGGKLNILYPRNGLRKHSAQECAIYFESLSQFSNLNEWILDGDGIAADKVGATYLFTDWQGIPYCFSIKSYKVDDGCEWGLWLGPLTDPLVRQRMDEISDYFEKELPIGR